MTYQDDKNVLMECVDFFMGTPRRFITSVLVATMLSFGVGTYISAGESTGSWNPLEQYRIEQMGRSAREQEPKYCETEECPVFPNRSE